MSNETAYECCLKWLGERGSWGAYNAMKGDGYDPKCDYNAMLERWQNPPAESVSPAPQEVKRYQPGSYLPSFPDDGTGMHGHPRGQYVEYSEYVSLCERFEKLQADYAAKCAELQKAESERERVNERLTTIRRHYAKSLNTSNMEIEQLIERAEKAESRLAEVRKALEMTMKALSVEQRLAVKAELEREGIAEAGE